MLHKKPPLKILVLLACLYLVFRTVKQMNHAVFQLLRTYFLGCLAMEIRKGLLLWKGRIYPLRKKNYFLYRTDFLLQPQKRKAISSPANRLHTLMRSCYHQVSKSAVRLSEFSLLVWAVTERVSINSKFCTFATEPWCDTISDFWVQNYWRATFALLPM